jgi:hypothetical protein
MLIMMVDELTMPAKYAVREPSNHTLQVEEALQAN